MWLGSHARTVGGCDGCSTQARGPVHKRASVSAAGAVRPTAGAAPDRNRVLVGTGKFLRFASTLRPRAEAVMGVVCGP